MKTSLYSAWARKASVTYDLIEVDVINDTAQPET